jgi:glycine dehydrogenase
MAIQLDFTDRFVSRHVGPSDAEVTRMLAEVGVDSLDDLIDRTIPSDIRVDKPLSLPEPRSEYKLLEYAGKVASRNRVFRSYIGMGYHDTITPPAILRNIFENPAWYTQYTPYQAEIAQGRLEALLNYQTMVIDLTGLEIANASLLDEGTAAAEAMMMLHRVTRKSDRNTFFVSSLCHPQTIEIVKTRALPIGVQVVVGDHNEFSFDDSVFGALLQYPSTDGEICDYTDFCFDAHDNGAHVVVAADLMSLALLRPPGEFGADVAVGSTQRFGVPLGYGGPHAAFFATREEFKRQIPGRIIGVTVDSASNRALRMALQTREQHIRRDKATSNICTAQVLLAVIAGMYAVYHGADGIRAIANRIHNLTRTLGSALERLGYDVRHRHFFDTLRVDATPEVSAQIIERALAKSINLRVFEDSSLGIALDETTSADDLRDLVAVFAGDRKPVFDLSDITALTEDGYRGPNRRTSEYLTHPVFDSYQSETDLMRYASRLAARDLSLTTSMIPLAGDGIPDDLQRAEVVVGGDHGLRGGLSSAEFRRFRRVRGTPRHSSLPSFSWRSASRRVSHSRVGAWHESRQRDNGWNEGRRREVRSSRQCRCRRSQGEGRGQQGIPGCAHDHVPVHARGFREEDPEDLRGGSCKRRPGLHGWRKHECTGRSLQAGRLRRGRMPSQSAQDVQHSSRGRRTRNGPGRCCFASGGIPAESSGY